jgi:uncharacterized membrane protein YoaK (UPF0700 family)
VNAAGYLGIAHRGVSHVTGQMTQMGIDLAKEDANSAMRAASLVVAFLAGATLSGALIRTAEVTEDIQRQYGIALLVETILLGAGAAMLAFELGPPELLVAMAMGLQNAMASTYSGAIVRTTHVTGITTDLGILLGQFVREGKLEGRRVRLLSMLLGAFLVGGLLGAVTFAVLGRFVLVPPALGLGAAAFVWIRLARNESQT